MATSRSWFVVVFSAGFPHAGMHYIEAEEHIPPGDAGRHTFMRDDRVIWSAPADHVDRVLVFGSRAQAIAFHKHHGADLDRNPVPARAAKSKPLSPIIEGFSARVSEGRPRGPLKKR